MDFLNNIIDSYNIPMLTAFLLWVITSINPCPLATNITAIAYISRQLNSIKLTILHSLVYALWRVFSYSLIIVLILYWFSSLNIAQIFQWYWDKVIWPILLIIGFTIIDIIKLPHFKWNNKIDKLKESLKSKWFWWSFFLGALFAIAFCPYSWVVFFGIMIPFILKSSFPVGLSVLYWLWTALPVMIFAIIIAFSIKHISKIFNLVWLLEKYVRYFIAITFILVWAYYTYNSIKWLISII